MKKTLSLILALSMILSLLAFFAVNAGAEYPAADSMDGYQNLCLSYTWNPGRSDFGRFDADTFMPFVAYYDTNGKMQDFFFDSYLFLPCVKDGASGARIHYDKENPTKAIDWTSYVEDTFYKGKNVDALETAMGRAKDELNQPDAKAGVILTILYPGIEAGSSFGSLGGKQLDFSKLDDRKYAIKWIIDEQLKLYNERGYENLDLIGFYWLEEYLRADETIAQERELFRYTSEYLHSLGLKFIWIPYYQTSGYQEWKRLGFDVACMQPNMYWMTMADDTRVAKCATESSTLGMGVEIEIDGRALTSAEYYNRYLDYLEGCMKKGAIDSIKMYYQDGMPGVFYRAWESSDARARSIYDLTYKYAKGTLTQSDIDNNRSDELKLDESVDWVSIGKSYTASKPFFDGNGAEYQLNDGKELTDGVLASTELGTDWHAFHNTLLDPNGYFNVTIDLGKTYEGLTDFVIEFSHIQKYGIDDPAHVINVYTSDDGENFELLAQPTLEFNGNLSYARYRCDGTNARYVKYTFSPGNANFVFCGEALVGIAKEVVEYPDDDNDSDNEQDVSSGEVDSDNDTATDENGSEIASDSDASTSDNKKSDNGWIVWVSVGAILAAGAIVAVLFVKKKKK